MPRTIVVTGASDGIGAAAARRLHREGHEVVVVGRSPGKTHAVAAELGAAAYVSDFSRLDEVRSLAAALAERYPRIDVLANNAGGTFGCRRTTADGHETTFQVNHLAPFLLTNLLLPTLLRSRASVISTSSAASWIGRIDLDHPERHLLPTTAYAAAKLANILFTRGLDRHYRAQGIAAVVFHPGIVATNFASGNRGPGWLAYHTPLRNLFMLSPELGADTLCWLAVEPPGEAWEPGLYYERRRLGSTNPVAYDDRLVSRFWDLSARMVGLPPTLDTAS